MFNAKSINNSFIEIKISSVNNSCGDSSSEDMRSRFAGTFSPRSDFNGAMNEKEVKACAQDKKMN